MMKVFTLLSFLLIGMCCYSQSTFYSGTLTNQNGSSETVFVKSKNYVVDKNGILKVYKNQDNASEMELFANNFSTLTFNEIDVVIESRVVKGLTNKPVILRKLVEGDVALNEYIDENGKSLFVTESDKQYQLLYEKTPKDPSILGYKKWLFTNYNPNNLNDLEYSNIKYKQKDLIEYFVENSQNSRKLDQEDTVNLVEIGLHAGLSANDFEINISSIDIDPFSNTSVRIGTEAVINLSPVTDKLALLAGFDYFSSIDGDQDIILNRQSAANSRDGVAKLSFDYVSVHAGVQYKIHFNKFSLSPYATFEYLLSGENDSFSLTDTREQIVVFETNQFAQSVAGFNIGLRADAFEKFYAFVEYGSLKNSSSIVQRGDSNNALSLESELTRLSFAIGYTIF